MEWSILPRTIFVDQSIGKKYLEILDKIDSIIIPNFTSNLNVNPPEMEKEKEIYDKFKKYHIYRMEKNIMDHDEIMKHGVSMSN